MKAAIIIPARYDSTRFPGKPLALINGKPLIIWTCQAAARAGLPVYVATDSARIADRVRQDGYSVIMTDECRNGTERCALACDVLGDEIDIVVNWQGDSPLLPPQWAADLAEHLCRAEYGMAATVATTADAHPGMVEVSFGYHGEVKDFYRVEDGADDRRFMHVGLYAYWRAALKVYLRLEPSIREQREGLEQLRWPLNLMSIMLRPCPSYPMRECNEPGDRQILGDLLKQRIG